MRENPKVTAEQLAEIIGITANGVRYHIKKLKTDQVITREGPTKSGKWVVIK